LGENECCSLDNIETSASKRLVTYVPHCANEAIFKPIDIDNDKIKDFKEEVIGKKEYDFILFYNNRNIRRKKPADCILAFKNFCDVIGEEKAKKCLFLMHTQSKDENGTDLRDVKNKLCPKYDVIFTENLRFSPEKLNMLYNIVDVTINLSDNEGWGLATTESIMAGTPIIATVTGGLQDQMGFVDDGGKPLSFSKEFPSNHNGRYRNHGSWVYPIYPACKTLQGSIPTPYIFADHVNYDDATKALLHFYNMGRDERKRVGLEGREWGLNGNLSKENTCKLFMQSLDAVFKHWKPRDRYDVVKVENEYRLDDMGIIK
jgi:glycosyltransferase involved in cell wall biosynthesis